MSLAAGVSSSLTRSVTPSIARCGRSVSPDVSIRKVGHSLLTSRLSSIFEIYNHILSDYKLSRSDARFSDQIAAGLN